VVCAAAQRLCPTGDLSGDAVAWPAVEVSAPGELHVAAMRS
jgi:hypothetical protein